MSNYNSTNLTPSVEEFVGWYNVHVDYGDGYPVLRTIEPLPPFEHAEFFELYFVAAKWFDGQVTVPPGAPFDPLDDPPLFVRSDADDRTLTIDADYRYLDCAAVVAGFNVSFSANTRSGG